MGSRLGSCRRTRDRLALLGPAVLAGSFLLLASCAGRDATATTQPLVIPRPGPDAGRAVPLPDPEGDPAPGVLDQDAANEMLATAEGLALEGHYGEALDLLNSVPQGAVPMMSRVALDALRIRLKRHLLQSVLVEALVVLDRERVAVGEPITGELVLVNMAREPLLIPAEVPLPGPGGQHSRSVLHLKLDVREFGSDGTTMDDTRTWNLDVGEDILLMPGERRSWPLGLDSAEINPLSVAYRRYTIGATLLPARIEIGTETWPGTLAFRERTCEVFPRNWEHLSAHPLERLGEAIAKRSPVHIPLAAALIPPEQRRAGVDLLRATLSMDPEGPRSGETQVAACVALAILTGESLPARPDVWRKRLEQPPWQ